MVISVSEGKKDMDVPSLRAIESALKTVESEKKALKAAFLELESQPSSANFLSFSWGELDAHFSSIHESLSRRFSELLRNCDSTSEQLAKCDHLALRNDSSLSSELDALCLRMDGRAVRDYIIGSSKDHNRIRLELSDSFLLARDPGVLVLEAVDDLCILNTRERQRCLVILDVFVKNRPDYIEEEVKERAKTLGSEWLKCTEIDRDATPLMRAVLYLAAGFRIGKEMDTPKLVACFAACCCYYISPHLLKMVEFDFAAVDSLIGKLLTEKKHLYAVRYVCELELGENFHPERIIKSYFENPFTRNDNLCGGGEKSLLSTEINELKLAIQLVDTYKLPYPKVELEDRIAMLQHQRSDNDPKRRWQAGTKRKIPRQEQSSHKTRR